MVEYPCSYLLRPWHHEFLHAGCGGVTAREEELYLVHVQHCGQHALLVAINPVHTVPADKRRRGDQSAEEKKGKVNGKWVGSISSISIRVTAAVQSFSTRIAVAA